MAHFAVLCIPTQGHIDPMAALARELQRRGHVATFLHHPDMEPLITGRGLAFHPVGGELAPAGTLEQALRATTKVKGIFGLRPLIRDSARWAAILCEILPQTLARLGVDAIIGDSIEPASGLVSRHLRLPHISVAAALPLNWEVGIPSPFVGWSQGDGRWHRLRDVVAQGIAARMQAPLYDVIRSFATRWRLGSMSTLEDCASGYAQIAQLTRSLDYSRRSLTRCFHYCGPLRERAPARVADATPGRARRAFASLGSLQGHRAEVFTRIAEAANEVGLELTIAHGGLLAPRAVDQLSRRAIVRDFVDYDDALEGLDVAIMHGGMNGILDALAHGVPLVTIPLAYEQAAIALRVDVAGAGLTCRPRALRRRLAETLRTVVESPRFASAAVRVQEEIVAAGGVRRAADIVEQVARTGMPCLNAFRPGTNDDP